MRYIVEDDERNTTVTVQLIVLVRFASIFFELVFIFLYILIPSIAADRSGDKATLHLQ
jgi:hypothetical protein